MLKLDNIDLVDVHKPQSLWYKNNNDQESHDTKSIFLEEETRFCKCHFA